MKIKERRKQNNKNEKIVNTIRVFCQKRVNVVFFLQINPSTQKPTGQPSNYQSNRNITFDRIYVYLTMYNFNIFQYYVVLALIF